MSTPAPDGPAPADPLDGAVYEQLKRIARHHLRGGGRATLSTTDLVHDAYLKFGAADATAWESRGHFFGSASRAMRQVLVDHARRRGAGKRGGGVRAVTLTGSDASLVVSFDDLLVVDEALDRLRALDERLCRVVELRFFGGLEEEEIAALLGVSARTVRRDWLKARLFLSRALGRD